MELYNYVAYVERVIDGDTIKLRIDLGFKITFTSNCRLAGIDAPEMKAGGQAAKTFLQRELLEETEVLIKSMKLDKYGRPVVTIYHRGENINQKIVDNGHAKKY